MTRNTFLKLAFTASFFINPAGYGGTEFDRPLNSPAAPAPFKLSPSTTEQSPPSIVDEYIADGTPMNLTIAIENKTANDINVATSEGAGNKVKRCIKLVKNVACKREEVIKPTGKNAIQFIEMDGRDLPKKGRFSFTITARQGSQTSHCKFENVSKTSTLQAIVDKSGTLNTLKCIVNSETL